MRRYYLEVVTVALVWAIRVMTAAFTPFCGKYSYSHPSSILSCFLSLVSFDPEMMRFGCLMDAG
jgi:hypothetical protein